MLVQGKHGDKSHLSGHIYLVHQLSRDVAEKVEGVAELTPELRHNAIRP